MRLKRIAAMATLGAAPVACAQVDGTATWLWDVTTENGDAVVEPGEAATITLSMDMDPNVNYPGGPVLGFGHAIFDTLGIENADKGAIVGWQILNDLSTLLGDATTTDGVSLYGSNPGQQPNIGPWTPDDPIAILEFQWRPAQTGAFDVVYTTSTEFMGVIQGTDDEDFFLVEWTFVEEAAVIFTVVPAPGCLALVVASSILTVGQRSPRDMG